MPNNNPRTPKRSWRGDRAASPRGSAGQPAWKGERAAAPGPRLSRGVKIGIALGLFLVAAVGLVAVILWFLPADPFCLVLIGADYEQNLNLDSNVAGRRGLDELATWAKGSTNPKIDVRAEARIDAPKDPVAAGLPTPDLYGRTSKTVVVFLSGDGGGDKNGAYLWLDGADPKTPGACYRVSQALDDLAKKLPEDTKKLLLLDGSHNGPSWSMGQLHNDFVRLVKQVDLPAHPVKNLVVLCSCDVDQQSWISEEYGQTIFAHYVIEGLKGAANKEWPGENLEGCNPGDGSLTALELARYVQCQVKRWVQHNRAMLQEPAIIDDGTAGGMELVRPEEYKGENPAPDAIPKWSTPADLSSAWAAHDRLAGAAPAPYVYAPLQWREYEDTLLRYEQLFRTGDEGSATTALRSRLDQLAGEIEKARQREGRSLANTLAAPAVFGLVLTKDQADQLQKRFEKAWKNNKEDEFKRLLSDLANPDGAPPLDRPTQQLLRLRLIGLILARAVQTPDSYKQACELLNSPVLAEGADPQVPLPAEANFAVMNFALTAPRGQDPPLLPASAAPPWDLVKQALDVRQVAEAAALGMDAKAAPPALSEQLLHWIQSDVEAADKDRREGEDLIYSSTAEDRTNAPARLAAAGKGYEAVVERARVLRRALLVRDQALAQLPFFTRWRAAEPLPAKEADVTALWARLHQLCNVLEKPNPDKELSDATDAVAKGLAQQQGDVDAACQRTSWQESQTPWRELEALLSLPFIPANDRMRLLAEQRKISAALNAGTAKADPAADEPTAPAAERTKSLAYQQARLALVVLGKGSKAGQEVQQELDKPEEPPWQAVIDRVGDMVGKGFLDKAKKAYDVAETGRIAPLEKDVPDHLDSLRMAAVDARFLDTGLAKAVLGDLDPVDEDRKVRLHDLFVWQADRARLDFWVNGDPADPKPYYQSAGKAYTTDARDLATAGLDREEAKVAENAKAVRSQATDDMDMKLAPRAVGFQWKDAEGNWGPASGSSKVAVTDEPDFRLEYQLVGDKDVPRGRPVVWAQPEAKGKPLLVVKEPSNADVPSSLPQAAGETPKDFTLRRPAGDESDPSRPAAQKTNFQLTGLFRGRCLVAATEVDLYNRPDLVSYQPKDAKDGFIAVQAPEDTFAKFAARNSELVIVIDYSGSMKAKNAAGKQRIEQALDALEACLAPEILPPGTKLTVLTFSSKERPGNGWVDDKPVWGPAAWDMKPKRLMGALSNLTPEGWTPLVRATGEALHYFSKDPRTSKSLLMITDGGDNLFYGEGQHTAEDDALRAEYHTIENYLQKTFAEKRIQINVAEFQVEDDDKKLRGYKDYKPAIEGLGGRYTAVSNTKQLAAVLGQYFLQLHYWVKDKEGHFVTTQLGAPDNALNPDEGWSISKFNDDANSSEGLSFLRVRPGNNYHVILQNHNRAADPFHTQFLDQEVYVGPGEVMVMDLVENPDDPSTPFRLRREVYAKATRLNLNKKPAQASVGNWLLTVLGNSRDTTAGQQRITAALERTDDYAQTGDTLYESRPRWTWFQVTKDGDAARTPARGLRFWSVPYHPSPVYELDLGGWPAGANSVMESWWWDKDGALPHEDGYECRRDREFTKSPAELYRRALTVHHAGAPDAKVVVQSVTIEPQLVELIPGRPQTRQCLVVRLTYPTGRPYFVMPTGVRPAGYEHRFFMDSNHYTGVFFDLNEQSLGEVQSLDLYSVNEIQSQAVHANPMPIRTSVTAPEAVSKD